MQIRRYVVTVASTDDVDADEHVSAEEIAGFLSDYIGNSYANLVECQRISDLQVVDSGLYSFVAVPEQECTEKCTTVQESTPTGVPEPEVPATEELTEEQQAITDAPQHAELPPEQPACGEADGDWPPLDVSKLDPPAAARWVAVDKDGRAYYYCVKPLCGETSWYAPEYGTFASIPGRYDISDWQEAIWPVNLDATQQADLPAEQPVCGEVDMSELLPRVKYPRLDISKLNPPEKARWVAVDNDGNAYYYGRNKPQRGASGWCGAVVEPVPGRYDASHWFEAIWPVNLTQGS